MSRAPQQEDLEMGLQVLRALGDPRRSDHASTVAALPNMTHQCGFVMMLLHVLAHGNVYMSTHNVTTDLRQMAGMLIKNYCVGIFASDPGGPNGALAAMLRESVLIGLMDESQEIRKTAASLLGRIADAYTHPYWSSIVPHLISVLQLHAPTEKKVELGDSSNPLASPFALDGAMHALVILLEDTTAKLAMDTTKPLESIVPLILEMFSTPSETNRLRAVLALNSLILSPEGDPLFQMMPQFLNALGSLTTDPSPSIRRAVCVALVLLATSHVECLQPCFHDVCAFMTKAIIDVDEGVAIEACEFWLALLNDTRSHPVLQLQLEALVPSCISRLKLTQSQVERETQEEEAQASGISQVKPQNILNRSNKGGGSEDEDLNYTIRKQCAYLLDNLAVAFPNGIAQLVAPFIWSCLQNGQSDLWEKEAALLALGAIAQGCSLLMVKNIGSIMPFVVEALQSQLQEVRAVACWCLSRYICWVEAVLDDNIASGQATLDTVIQGLLATLRDTQPKVQAAACSALAILVSTILPEYLQSYAEQILTSISSSWPNYGLKNRLLLMDVIGETCSSVSEEMHDTRITQLYLPHIIIFLQEHSSPGKMDDVQIYLIIPPLECLANLFRSVPDQVLSRAQSTTHFCLQIIERFVSNKIGLAGNLINNSNDEDLDEEDIIDDQHSKDIVVTALQLISAMVEGFKSSCLDWLILPSHKVGSTIGDCLKDQLLICLGESHLQVHIAALEVVGELTQNAPFLLLPTYAPRVFETVLADLAREIDGSSDDLDSILRLKNNAVWVSGLIATSLGEAAMSPFLPHLVNALVQLVLSTAEVEEGTDFDDSLLKANLCITFGRLLLVSLTTVSAVLTDVLVPLLIFMRELQPPFPNTESAECWKGFLIAIHNNSQLINHDAQARQLFQEAVYVALQNSSELDGEVGSALCSWSLSS